MPVTAGRHPYSPKAQASVETDPTSATPNQRPRGSNTSDQLLDQDCNQTSQNAAFGCGETIVILEEHEK